MWITTNLTARRKILTTPTQMYNKCAETRLGGGDSSALVFSAGCHCWNTPLAGLLAVQLFEKAHEVSDPTIMIAIMHWWLFAKTHLMVKLRVLWELSLPLDCRYSLWFNCYWQHGRHVMCCNLTTCKWPRPRPRLAVSTSWWMQPVSAQVSVGCE